MKNIAIVYQKEYENSFKACLKALKLREINGAEIVFGFYPTSFNELKGGYALQDFIPQEWDEVYVLGLNCPELTEILYGYETHIVSETARELFDSLADNRGMNPLLFDIIDISLLYQKNHELYPAARGLSYHLRTECVDVEEMISLFNEWTVKESNELVSFDIEYWSNRGLLQEYGVESLALQVGNDIVVKDYPTYIKTKDVVEYVSFHHPNKNISIEVA